MMKINISNYFFACVFVFGLFGNAVADLSNGLVAHYPFNGNANDESGNGNHGVVYGATLSEDRFTNSDSAYGFDGSDQVNIPDSQSIRPINAITVSAWVHPVDIFTWHQVITKRISEQENPYNSYIIDSTNEGLNNRWRFCISNGITSGSQDCVNDTDIIVPNTWSHVVGLYDGESIKLLVNGKLKAVTAKNGSIGYTDLSLRIGQAKSWPEQNFNGRIDDIRIYDRALSESEIQELYNEGNAKLTISPPSGDYFSTQMFDLGLIVEAPGLSVGVINAALDGSDVSTPLSNCVTQGTLVSGGQTFRCGGLSGGFLGSGIHTLDVTLDLSDGSSVSDTVTWEVKENIEKIRTSINLKNN